MIKNNFTKYHQAVSFLESTVNFPIKDRLLNLKDRTFFQPRLDFLLKLLGKPHLGLNYIQVTGTAGKGTVVNYLHEILTATGYKVGSYFSPHTSTVIERIKINRLFISTDEFVDLVEYLKPYLTKTAELSPYGHPSYFETLLALAFVYFKKNKCQYVILEAGLGGENDASNIIPYNKLALITNVDYDHMEILGNTLSAIAKEKAGIIKKGSVFLTTETRLKLLKIFEQRCHKIKAKYLPISGNQTDPNKLLASSAAQTLKIPQLWINKELFSAKLPCRFEIIQKKPLIILDGAHNPSKMHFLRQKIENLKYDKLHLLIGMAADKDHYRTLREIVPLADRLYLTRYLMPFRKTADLQKLNQISRKIKPQLPISTSIDPDGLLKTALKNLKKNDCLLITGSFFLAGELRKNWITENQILSHRRSF
jgi:dihydrofolate synthase / folylpolyglutamate synthase